MFVQNLKFVGLPIPEIIGGLNKFGQSLDRPTLPFLCSLSFLTEPTYRVNVGQIDSILADHLTAFICIFPSPNSHCGPQIISASYMLY